VQIAIVKVMAIEVGTGNAATELAPLRFVEQSRWLVSNFVCNARSLRSANSSQYLAVTMVAITFLQRSATTQESILRAAHTVKPAYSKCAIRYTLKTCKDKIDV
jgi:hypothetical protein